MDRSQSNDHGAASTEVVPIHRRPARHRPGTEPHGPRSTSPVIYASDVVEGSCRGAGSRSSTPSRIGASLHAVPRSASRTRAATAARCGVSGTAVAITSMSTAVGATVTASASQYRWPEVGIGGGRGTAGWPGAHRRAPPRPPPALVRPLAGRRSTVAGRPRQAAPGLSRWAARRAVSEAVGGGFGAAVMSGSGPARDRLRVLVDARARPGGVDLVVVLAVRGVHREAGGGVDAQHRHPDFDDADPEQPWDRVGDGVTQPVRNQVGRPGPLGDDVEVHPRTARVELGPDPLVG